MDILQSSYAISGGGGGGGDTLICCSYVDLDRASTSYQNKIS